MSFLSMGTVYGTALNFKGELAALGSRANEPPHNAPPASPVLYIKPANTWSQDGAEIAVPADVAELEVGATIGFVMRAPGVPAGYVLMNDLSIPHESLFRPPVRFKCLDGSLGVGRTMMRDEDCADPAWFVVEVRINGELRQTMNFTELVRTPRELLEEVSAFMTLGAGDVLLLGSDTGRPRAKVGDRIEISAEGLGTLTNTLVAEAA